MRIVIDMQGAQTESKFRGIGRYTLSFAKAIARNCGSHEIFLVLNGMITETIEPIRIEFSGILPSENIKIWHSLAPIRTCDSENHSRHEIAVLTREAFIASLQADLVHIPSIFEGYADNAAVSIGRFDYSTPVSVTLHDLIPLANPVEYLDHHPAFSSFYHKQISYIKKSAIMLTISDFSCTEGIKLLNISSDRILSISSACEPIFSKLPFSESYSQILLEKFKIDRPFILYSGGSDKRKNLHNFIKAFASLPSSLRSNFQLVFTGWIPISDLSEIKTYISLNGLKPRDFCYAGLVTDEELVFLYNYCSLFVFPSWHEGFGLPALEAMSCGAAVIGSNTSSLPEVIGTDEALFDPYNVAAISQKIFDVLTNDSLRMRLQQHGFVQSKKFSMDASARLAISAWENLLSNNASSYIPLQPNNLDIDLFPLLSKETQEWPDEQLAKLASVISKNDNLRAERQLLVDITEFTVRDAATGIQRVVRNYLRELLAAPPQGYRVEPVYHSDCYRYARYFTDHFLGNEATRPDDPLICHRGDIFFSLDLMHDIQIRNASFYQHLRKNGVIVKFLVYDLLPIQLQETFDNIFAGNSDGLHLKIAHEKLISVIASCDEAIAISRTTAIALNNWILDQGIPTSPHFCISWINIGSDNHDATGSTLKEGESMEAIEIIRSRPSFLTVSTLEPRKKHDQILAAFELLWHQGNDLNLVFIGKRGWNVDELISNIQSHPEYNKRLFWLHGISDTYLEHVYAVSTCLIAASLNEGFGLPIIEAARHSLPVICRDIPVFREVSADGAQYFNGLEPQKLATAVLNWLKLFADKSHPSPTSIQFSTWKQSSEKLKQILINRNGPPSKHFFVDVHKTQS